METKECGFSGFKMNGFLALFLHLVVLTAVIIFGFIISVPTLILSVCLCLVWFIMFAGYMELEPNEARAMVFFGKYKGTFKETGFFWVNPFLNKKKLPESRRCSRSRCHRHGCPGHLHQRSQCRSPCVCRQYQSPSPAADRSALSVPRFPDPR